MLTRLVVLCLFATVLPAINVKVEEVDYRLNEALLYLPMHQARLRVEKVPESPEMEVQPGEFYEAQLIQRAVEVGTPCDGARQSLIRVRVPDRPWVVFLVRAVVFEEAP
jgi:hypothetical protein